MNDNQALAQIVAENYCPHCSHPWGYHKVEDGCHMPVNKTKLPIARLNEPHGNCGCSLHGKWVMRNGEGTVLRADSILTELLSDSRCKDGQVTVTYCAPPSEKANEQPVSDEEIEILASGKFETMPSLMKQAVSESQWTAGFVAGMRNAVDRLEHFGMSDYDIRNALGMIKK